MEDFFKVGVISSTHGIKGEMKVFPTTEDLNRFKKLKEVKLDNNGKFIDMNIESVKFFKQFAIIKFKNYNSINDIECFKGMSLYVERKNAIKLEADEYYKADLLGCKMISDDKKWEGVLSDILETGANDVYVIQLSNEKEILLPAIKECIIDVDVVNQVIIFHLLDGLMD